MQVAVSLKKKGIICLDVECKRHRGKDAGLHQGKKNKQLDLN